MAVVPGDKAKGMKDPPIWAEYRAIVKEAEGKEVRGIFTPLAHPSPSSLPPAPPPFSLPPSLPHLIFISTDAI